MFSLGHCVFLAESANAMHLPGHCMKFNSVPPDREITRKSIVIRGYGPGSKSYEAYACSDRPVHDRNAVSVMKNTVSGFKIAPALCVQGHPIPKKMNYSDQS